MAHILISLDFTAHAKDTFLHGLKLATALNLDVKAIHVLHGPAENPGFYSDYIKEGTPKPLDEIAEIMYVDLVQSITDEKPEYKNVLDNVDFKVIEGVPTTRLLEIIEDSMPEYVVMGSHGRSGMRKLLVGSTTEKIVSKSPVPVLVIKPERIEDEES